MAVESMSIATSFSNSGPLLRYATTLIALFIALGPSARGQEPNGDAAVQTDPASETDPGAEVETKEVQPFDFDPYRTLIWVASDSPRVCADTLRDDLQKVLDRDFHAVWRTKIEDAPMSVASMAMRVLSEVNFDTLAATDPVIAVKRSHGDAVRIRFAGDVGRYASSILTTTGRMEEINARLAGDPDSPKNAWLRILHAIEGDAVALKDAWAKEDTEAILVSRGMAETLTEPEAKIIVPPITGQVIDAAEAYDKIFIVRIRTATSPMKVESVEFDTLMRYFGDTSRATVSSFNLLPEVVGATLRDVFAPVARIDDAGKSNAVGLVRASGLVTDKNSPALVDVGDVLVPMVRKDDRNGNPISIGPLDWAYLLAKELDGRRVKMDFHAGRAGGLQGRKNARTHRVGLRIRPRKDQTLLRLHAKGDPNQPLIGYEIYEKELEGKSMTFIGRTDWNGRLDVEPTDEQPLRLLYVKNGGAVLARLPMVPGHHEKMVADLGGDDMRLQAESYIRGVQNSIIDLLAIRELFKARIMMRLERGDLEPAEELLEVLRNQPTNERLANDMGKRQSEFIKAIGKNANQQRKVDEMFSVTREMLTKHINPKLVRDLEEAVIVAKENGGKLPPKSDEETDGA
ncbi:MAG TPA: hypothetical protein DDX19_14130 [Rhodopirellula baltica]|uniref:Uncharacterized protein n=1 Tax=Rhodopirellula baltica (strain DSM 10527 / NCIMB 13988 / SH1) TaxID=243090 RepID=Q7UKD2_RHOBA|nr:hypothetical protein [Rhodopirellula baltica]CAD76949.1 hypothetical protein-signal peptide prediction [Rhodopirellula baltica SH 1]HBE63846.1 hypothetical protein [Rhodopirellula baltica]